MTEEIKRPRAKYLSLVNATPEVEVLPPSQQQSVSFPNSNPGFEVEFVLPEYVPETEKNQTRQTWNAFIETGGEVRPELVITQGLGQGRYQVPTVRYRLNNKQRFTNLYQNLIFEARQNDRVLVAVYIENNELSLRNKELESTLGAQLTLPGPETTADEADRFLRVMRDNNVQSSDVVIRNSNLYLLSKEVLNNPEKMQQIQSKIIKVAAVFLDDDLNPKAAVEEQVQPELPPQNLPTPEPSASSDTIEIGTGKWSTIISDKKFS